ncbi:polyprenyl synthetase family protein [Corynebacterium sp. TAE3-ERU12]|uniref:polyprenyl synthetase family protein n=1 Tax=Corynebacterium sp. TAE3-ERU12 TaxID=2849491 RepID=UPI001C48EF35|nr:polyprenyl synthetase family protein [Corynebacterium sp. TAE3-ERU12]MBV7296236.1 polyprenyl synthetase family protein [Corynebacterium sp. TAE3-ERU12]
MAQQPTAPLPGPEDVPAAVNASLRKFLNSRRNTAVEIDPYFTQLVDAVNEFTLQGGKRVRPTFLWAGWLASGGADTAEDPAAVLHAAAALELVQACALIHDDIIDASDTRRGNPTVHRRFEAVHRDSQWHGDGGAFGRAMAILGGDLAMVWADDMLRESGLSTAALVRLQNSWWRMRTEVLGGQAIDIVAETSGDGRFEVAERINTYKTAAYTIERPLLIGSEIADASEDITHALATYGRNVGIAFQLRDDQLGLFGDPEVTGKPAGDDLRQGKRTMLLATALEKLQETAPDKATYLNESLGVVTDLEEISELTELIRSTGADDKMEQEIARRTERGLDALEIPELAEEHRSLLRSLAEKVTVRKL